MGLLALRPRRRYRTTEVASRLPDSFRLLPASNRQESGVGSPRQPSRTAKRSPGELDR